MRLNGLGWPVQEISRRTHQEEVGEVGGQCDLRRSSRTAGCFGVNCGAPGVGQRGATVDDRLVWESLDLSALE